MILASDEMQQLVMRLRRDEGQRLRAYDDATGQPVNDPSELKGKLTIADGFNLQREAINKVVMRLMLAGVKFDHALVTLKDLCKLTITAEQADKLLQNDLIGIYISKAASLVDGASMRGYKTTFTNFTPARRVAWVDFVYNEGGDDFPGTEHLLAQAQALKDAGDARAHATFKLAADHMRLSAWYGQVGDRAKRVTAMIETGVYCSPTGDGSDVLHG